jgi:hypothetical protein
MALMLAVGVCLLPFGGTREVGVLFVVLSVFVFARSVGYVFTLVLFPSAATPSGCRSPLPRRR